MTSNWVNIILGIIGGGYLLGIAALITAMSNRKKAKADALSSVEGLIKSQLERADEEARKWKDECEDLTSKVQVLAVKVEENHECQGMLTLEINNLKEEKIKLMGRVRELENKIQELEKENNRLKQIRVLHNNLIDSVG
jgi:FtsZ-binding cell division protein ZapB